MEINENFCMGNKTYKLKKEKLLIILSEYHNENNNELLLNYDPLRSYFFSRDFMDICFHEILPIENQIDIFDSLSLLIYHQSLAITQKTNYLMLFFLDFWEKKLSLLNHLPKTINLEGIYRLTTNSHYICFKNDVDLKDQLDTIILKSYSDIFQKISSFKEQTSKKNFINYFALKKIWKITKKFGHTIDYKIILKKTLEKLLNFSKKLAKKFSIFEEECHIILKYVIILLSLNNPDYNEIYSLFNQICSFFEQKS